MIAFGRVQFVDEHGIKSDWLDIYRESAAAGIWKDVGSPRRMIGFVARSAFGTSFPMSGDVSSGGNDCRPKFGGGPRSFTFWGIGFFTRIS